MLTALAFASVCSKGLKARKVWSVHQLLQKFNLKTSIVSKTSIASTLLYTNTTCFNTRLQTWRTETRWSQKACSLLPRSSVGSTEGDKSFFCWTFLARHLLFLFDLLQNVIGLLLALICYQVDFFCSGHWSGLHGHWEWQEAWCMMCMLDAPFFSFFHFFHFPCFP